MSKITITIDDKTIEARTGQSVLEAALDNGIYIPHLCHHPDLKPGAVCRLCIVELPGGRLVTACRLIAAEGMSVKVKSPAVDRAVRPVVELLIGHHHITCRGCPASGKCELQTVMAYMKIDRKRVRRLRPPALTRPIVHMTPLFDYDPNRCVLCGICVGASEIAHGASLFQYTGRGHETQVTYFGAPEEAASCLRIIERCPVGAFVLRPPPAATP